MNATSSGGGGPPGGGGRPGPRGPSFTQAQRQALWNIPRITGALSLIGSCLIIYMIFKSSQNKLNTVQNRLLLGISIVDLPFSLMFCLGTILMPSFLPVNGAYGNFHTCSFQGSMLQIGYAQPIYNAILMTYYAITVCGRGIATSAENSKRKWIEPACHAFCILFAIGTAVSGGVLGIFNPSPIGRCAINAWPMGCVGNEFVECQRGEHHRAFKWAYNLGPTLVSLAVILIALLALSWKVILHEQRVRHNARQRQEATLASATTSQTYSSQVVTRAVWYAVIFLNTYVWITVANLIRVVAHTPPSYWLVLVGNVLQPFQGFLNFVLYIQPRYAAVERVHSTWQWWRILWFSIRHGTASLQSSLSLTSSSRRRGLGRRDSSMKQTTRWSMTTSYKQRSSLCSSGEASGQPSVEIPSEEQQQQQHAQVSSNVRNDCTQVAEEESGELSETFSVEKIDPHVVLVEETTLRQSVTESAETDDVERGISVDDTVKPSDSPISQRDAIAAEGKRH